MVGGAGASPFARKKEKEGSTMKTRVLGALALGASVVPMFAADPVTLPDTGIDMASYINAAITGLGAIVGAAVLGYFAFLLIKKGLKWSGKLGG